MDTQQFLAEFGHIANAPNGIVQLRELVLCLAMQGKLIPQGPEESTSAALLATVEQDKARLISSGVIKSPKPLPGVGPSDISHALPSTWAWVRFGDIALHNSGKTLDSVRNSGLPRDYITTSNLYWGRFELGNVKKMLIREDELGKCTARKNDLLICEGGEAGRAAVWVADTEVCFQNHVHRARFYGGINPFFAYRFFEKLNCTGEINAHRKGIGISNMSSKALAMIPFPLPPVEEQSRIVAKVDELMALCDTLEAQQQARRKLQNNLRLSTLQAVASATSPHELQFTWLRLAENFGQLFHVPEDVVAFKGLILDLAVLGELLNIEHCHSSTGDDLINAIAIKRIEWSKNSTGQEQKEALAVLRKLRTQHVAISDVGLPEHWTWASMLQVSQVIIDCDHKTPAYADSGIHLIRTTDVRNGSMRLDATKKISKESHLARSRRLTPQPGDIFFTREAPMGEAAIVPNGESVCLGQRLMLIRLFGQLFSNRFFIYVIQSPSFQKRLKVSAIGMTVKHINVGDVENLMIPVPPRPEQDRIVAIVDDLFRMCDHYADQLSRKQRIATNLAISAVSNLTGIAIEQEEEPMKAPQTELIAPLRLGTAPDIKAQAPLATILARNNGEMSAKDLWQRFGGEVDAFYAQLKNEVAHGWILEPASAEMREKQNDAVSA
ncbi:Type I restriction-modification system, specificity subunit S [Candidatus Nitrotoga sp. BS]|uniref:restriction endonuclease subunit S n=1 Tax=Candidatus Nitrotoga sp. BS TaxID=2890408 RepID=UPI001EF1E3E5|nr:restriction endonuclease subunit S [Candidatus Nitrotoga sp. BS]CAH1207526.1 Type I restriction-modification system, specificity subunit S [Candidatus Nitrotoga sp. BS]